MVAISGLVIVEGKAVLQPCVVFFFFNDTATTEIYTLSLHDALPISRVSSRAKVSAGARDQRARVRHRAPDIALPNLVATFSSTFTTSTLNRRSVVFPRKQDRSAAQESRSEEHTSELQSPDHLVCRLL